MWTTKPSLLANLRLNASYTQMIKGRFQLRIWNIISDMDTKKDSFTGRNSLVTVPSLLSSSDAHIWLQRTPDHAWFVWLLGCVGFPMVNTREYYLNIKSKPILHSSPWNILNLIDIFMWHFCKRDHLVLRFASRVVYLPVNYNIITIWKICFFSLGNLLGLVRTRRWRWRQSRFLFVIMNGLHDCKWEYSHLAMMTN